MKYILLIVLVIALASAAHAFRYLPATWRHDLGSTRLVGYKKGEHLIVSSIVTGTVGRDAVQKYGLDVKVSAWGKPFTAMQQSKDKKQKEVLIVTLYKMADIREMKAVFDDTVYESGKVKLKFSGTTLLARLD